MFDSRRPYFVEQELSNDTGRRTTVFRADRQAAAHGRAEQGGRPGSTLVAAVTDAGDRPKRGANFVLGRFGKEDHRLRHEMHLPLVGSRLGGGRGNQRVQHAGIHTD